MEDLTKDPHALDSNGIPEAHKKKATVLRFYIGPREKPGLGMDVSGRLFEDPGLGRLVIENARKLIDDLEKTVAAVEEDLKKGVEDLKRWIERYGATEQTTQPPNHPTT